MNLYGGGVIARTLKHYGVGHLFALPGHQIQVFSRAGIKDREDLVTRCREAAARLPASMRLATDRIKTGMKFSNWTMREIRRNFVTGGSWLFTSHENTSVASTVGI